MDSGNARPGHRAGDAGSRSWRAKLETDLGTDEVARTFDVRDRARVFHR